jgi:hypothetical protein
MSTRAHDLRPAARQDRWVPTADAIAATRHATRRSVTVTSRREIADAGRAGVVMGWARGTLTVATGVVLTLIVTRVTFGRSLIDALNVSAAVEPFSSEVAGFTAAVLPGMLVAWCLGFAAAATAVRATWLGARVAGILSGALGVTAGIALLVLSR